MHYLMQVYLREIMEILLSSRKVSFVIWDQLICLNIT